LATDHARARYSRWRRLSAGQVLCRDHAMRSLSLAGHVLSRYQCRCQCHRSPNAICLRSWRSGRGRSKLEKRQSWQRSPAVGRALAVVPRLLEVSATHHSPPQGTRSTSMLARRLQKCAKEEAHKLSLLGGRCRAVAFARCLVMQASQCGKRIARLRQPAQAQHLPAASTRCSDERLVQRLLVASHIIPGSVIHPQLQ